MSLANGLTNTLPFNQRELLDENFIVTASLPNAANTVNTSGLDLVQATPYPTTDRIDVNILCNGLGVGANNKNINFRLQDSPDNTNWTNVAVFANPIVQTNDNGNTFMNATGIIFKLAPTSQRYIRAVALGEANGGNSSAGTFTLQLLF